MRTNYSIRVRVGAGLLAAFAAAELWMPLLVPATDPKAVVFDLRTTPGTAPLTGQPAPERGSSRCRY